MATSGSSPTEIRRAVVANADGSTKKRKFMYQQTNMRLSKHICHTPHSSADSSRELNEFSNAVKFDPDSALDNDCFDCNTDSMIISVEPKTDLGNQQICSTSSPTWGSVLPKSGTTVTEPLLPLGDCSCSENGNNDIEQCMDTQLEDLLCSTGIDPTNYIISSGRWSVNRDDQNGGEKLTIDKEFEQYFSMLML